MRGDKERLLDILDAAAEIERLISGRSEPELDQDKTFRHAALYLVQVIGEARQLCLTHCAMKFRR